MSISAPDAVGLRAAPAGAGLRVPPVGLLRRAARHLRHLAGAAARRRAGHHRRQRRRQVDAAAVAGRPDEPGPRARTSAASIEFDGQRLDQPRRPSASSTPAWRWCPRAGGCSRGCRSRTTCSPAPTCRVAGRRCQARLEEVYALFPRLRERRRQVVFADVGRRAADGGDRPRADVVADADRSSTSCRSACRRRWSTRSTRTCSGSTGRASPRHRRAGPEARAGVATAGAA